VKARITDHELAALERQQFPRGSGTLLVAEIYRLRAILDRVYESCSAEDEELDAEVREIRQERRSAAVAAREKER
jgi:hypothetical protein